MVFKSRGADEIFQNLLRIDGLVTLFDPSKSSIKATPFLSPVLEFEIEFELGGKFYDFYLPDSNTLVEIDGAYWHSRGIAYKDMTLTQKKNYENDKIKDKLAVDNGFGIIRIWEDEIK